MSIINIMIIIFIPSQKGYPNAIYGRDKNWLAWDLLIVNIDQMTKLT